MSGLANVNFWLKWIATGSTIIGATLTVLKIDPLNIAMLNLGCVLFVIWSWRIREPSLIITNGGLLMIYGFGAIIRAYGY